MNFPEWRLASVSGYASSGLDSSSEEYNLTSDVTNLVTFFGRVPGAIAVAQPPRVDGIAISCLKACAIWLIVLAMDWK